MHFRVSERIRCLDAPSAIRLPVHGSSWLSIASRHHVPGLSQPVFPRSCSVRFRFAWGKFSGSEEVQRQDTVSLSQSSPIRFRFTKSNSSQVQSAADERHWSKQKEAYNPHLHILHKR
ncbi:hypothetical protein AVEN_188952-1 [Araneus ventricosus]|uniref:Uncharacterized protein n=1 Tax=Araneus ventricosus TaxID=182803 RepID=A0A4Y1ZJF3_ARAVE|nr:hypothetical protein AVEN_188952-1 [Araneus ventricosus]